jgi:hypothetical protein
MKTTTVQCLVHQPLTVNDKIVVVVKAVVYGCARLFELTDPFVTPGLGLSGPNSKLNDTKNIPAFWDGIEVCVNSGFWQHTPCRLEVDYYSINRFTEGTDPSELADAVYKSHLDGRLEIEKQLAQIIERIASEYARELGDSDGEKIKVVPEKRSPPAARAERLMKQAVRNAYNDPIFVKSQQVQKELLALLVKKHLDAPMKEEQNKEDGGKVISIIEKQIARKVWSLADVK